MKVKIEIEEGLPEDEVIIRCVRLNDDIISLQNLISKLSNGKRHLALRSGETDYYIPIGEIYFFETNSLSDFSKPRLVKHHVLFAGCII